MSSREEQKAKLRAEREARERAAEAAARRRRVILGIVATIALAATIAGVIALLGGGDGAPPADTTQPVAGGLGELGEVEVAEIPPQQETDLEAAAKAADCQLREDKDTGNDHLDTLEERVEYKTNPATSGTHYIMPAEDGSYAVAPQTEPTVHSLEHGRINLQWSPDAAPEAVGAIGAIFTEDPYHMLAFQNQTEMPYEVAASAWNQAITCETYNDKVPDALRTFKETYRDQGPEFVP